MITKDVRKHRTLCWTCKWAAGKDKKCPWASKFEPVPGWKAVPTELKATVGSAFDKIDSFDVYECPLYELMDEMKHKPADNSGKTRMYPKDYSKDIEYIKQYQSEGKTIEQIAEILCISERTLYRICRKIRESEKNEEEI